MDEMRCWQCGAEPLEVHEITTLDNAQLRYLPGLYPPAEDGHQHATKPPSPAELKQAGHRTLMRIREAALDL
jgi:hypothetical protein